MGNVLYYATQTAPNSDEWSDEQELKGTYASQIQVTHYEDGRLALFFLDMGREIGVIEETEKNSGLFAKHQMLDLYGNYFEVGKHQDGTVELGIIGTMANVLTHASAGENGQWDEKEINGGYAIDIEMRNNASGELQLIYIQPDKEIAIADLSGEAVERKKLDMYSIGIESTNHADGQCSVTFEFNRCQRMEQRS